jgi:hypothetical protein
VHFGDIAEVECRAAHDLYVEMAHSEGAPGGLAHRGEGFGQQVVEAFAVGVALFELGGEIP